MNEFKHFVLLSNFAAFQYKTKTLFKRNQQQSFDEGEQIRLSQLDHRHFGVLYEAYFDSIYRFIYKRLGGNEEVAGDLSQQTFMKAMANIGKYEDRGYPFSAWLYRIALNEVNLFFRNQKKEFTVEINDNQLVGIIEDAGERNVSQFDLEQLIEILNTLEHKQSEIIELRFFQKMSFKEIAAIYSISEANAKMRIYRILEKIKEQWKREES